VEAVRCAVEIQERLADAGATLTPDRRMQFRMGVNLGDVMVEQDNLFGEGVNAAARLQELAPPGGICISGTVFDQVRARLDLTYEGLGARQVKNIADPVRGTGEGADTAPKGPSAPRRNWRPLVIRGVALVAVFSTAWAIGRSPPSPPTLADPTIAVFPFRTIGEGGPRPNSAMG
jgi:adenylate cyclase